MSIDWTHFTPWTALAGGLLIGAAALAFILVCGRILGVAGIVGGLLPPQEGDSSWRFAFVGGLIVPALISQIFGIFEAPRFETGPVVLAIAGVLVGIGTRLGSGCTSGHGICGLARFSQRSLVATLCFMASAAATVFVVRHML